MWRPGRERHGDVETVRNASNDPVFGTAIVAAEAPSTETAIVRPLFGLATRAVMVYAPAVRDRRGVGQVLAVPDPADVR